MSGGRKALYAAVTCVLLFAGVEVALWAGGVPTLLEREDPWRGFSGLLSVFERDGSVYRTRPESGYISFNPQSFQVRKPEHGLRVFCVGGSSAFGFPWGAHEAFTGILGDVLAAAHPGKVVEAVNAAGLSYAMHRVRLVVDEILHYEPDLVIVYCGHNEFVEPAVFRALQQRAPELTRIEFALAHSRLYGGLRSLLMRDAAAAPAELRFERFVRRELGTYSESDKREVVARYRAGLEHVLRSCRARKVPVLLATLPCNLRDW